MIDEEAACEIQSGADEPNAGTQQRFYKGRLVTNEEEMAQMDCPFPREEEWEEEWSKWESEQTK